MTFPDSDEDLFNSSPCEHGNVDCQHLTESIDVRLSVLPAIKQFAIDVSSDVRAYALCGNFGYFPANVDCEIFSNSDAVQLTGILKGTIRVPPLTRAGKPGVRARMATVQAQMKKGRCEIVARWRSNLSSTTVVVAECNVAIQTI